MLNRPSALALLVKQKSPRRNVYKKRHTDLGYFEAGWQREVQTVAIRDRPHADDFCSDGKKGNGRVFKIRVVVDFPMTEACT